MNTQLWLHSVGVAAGTLLVASVAGLAVAISLLVAGKAGRRLGLMAGAATLALPPFLLASCWLELTAAWRTTLGAERASLFMLPITALVLGLGLWPLTLFFVLGAWQRIQPAVLEAEPELRGRGLICWVLWPAARTALGLASVLTLTLALANFTVPTLFQVRVFTEEFWIRYSTQFDLRGALATTWPLWLLPVGLGLAFRGRRVAWPRETSELPARLVAARLGAGWVWLARILCAGVLLGSLALPLAQLMGHPRTWTELPGAFAAGRLATSNSFLAAAITALVVLGLSLAMASLGRRRPRGMRARISDLAARALWLLFLLPGVFLSVGLILVLNRPPFAWFYGSFGMVWLALTLRYLAPVWSGVVAARRAEDTTLRDTASVLGARGWSHICLVEWPQSGRAMLAVAYAVYLLCLWDVETLVLLQPPGGETLALRIFNLLHYGHGAQVNALCLVTLGLALLPPLLFWSGQKLLPPRSRRRASEMASQNFPLSSGSEGSRSGRRLVTFWTLVPRRLFWSLRLKFRAPPFWRGEAFRPLTTLASVSLAVSLGFTLGGCSDSNAAETRSNPLNSQLFSAVQVIGSRGVAPGQFNKPRSLTCDRADNLYVADVTGRIQKFSPEGRFVLQWQMPETVVGKAKGMGLDPAGNVIVVEPHYQRVNHFTTNGVLVAQWGRRGTNPGEFILPRCVAVNSAGEYFLGEYTTVERVQKFSIAADLTRLPASAETTRSAYTLLESWGQPGQAPGDFNRAEGIAIGPGDRVYVADSCNHRIQVFDRDGHFLRAYGQAGSGPGEFSFPYDLRVDSLGRQFVCEFGNSRVSVFDATDRLVETIGHAGRAPGEFANPWAICFDSKGNLYVADSQNHRVQKLLRRPQTLAALGARISLRGVAEPPTGLKNWGLADPRPGTVKGPLAR